MVDKKVVKWKTRETLGFLVEIQYKQKFVVPFDYKRPPIGILLSKSVRVKHHISCQQRFSPKSIFKDLLRVLFPVHSYDSDTI